MDTEQVEQIMELYISSLKIKSQAKIMNFIRLVLRLENNLLSKSGKITNLSILCKVLDSKNNKNLRKKKHISFNMSGYDDAPYYTNGYCTSHNMDILNKFAFMGIYNHTSYLFLDFYKGTPTLNYQYLDDSKEINRCENYTGHSTTEIIYDIFKLTIFSDSRKRRRTYY